jgi:hypothetical protein
MPDSAHKISILDVKILKSKCLFKIVERLENLFPSLVPHKVKKNGHHLIFSLLANIVKGISLLVV